MNLQFSSFEQSNTSPDNNTNQQIKRIMLLLNYLPHWPNQGLTTTEVYEEITLQMGFDVSRKTVERDLKDSFLNCPEIESEQSAFDGKIRWYKKSQRNNYTYQMSYHEAVLLSLAQENLADLLPEATKQFFSKKFSTASQLINHKKHTSQLS